MISRSISFRALVVVVCAAAAAGVLALTASSPAAKTKSNRTDAIFAGQMLPHHEDGVELGKIAVEKGVDQNIKELGANIVRVQTREAQKLERMVERFDSKPTTAREIANRADIDMTKLEKASGEEFDRVWLDVISAHHMGAIQMATMEARGGEDKAARRLSRAIIAQQREELDRFNMLSPELG